MPTFRFVESAAATAVGTIMNNGQRGQSSGRNRRVDRIRVGGSATAGDAGIDLFYGDTYIGRFFTSVAGAAPAWDQQRDNQFPDQNWAAAAGENINCIIADASGTNALLVEIDTTEF